MTGPENADPALLPVPDTIRVIEERLHVETREHESGRAKVHVTVSERDEAVETLLKRRDLVVERVAVGTRIDVIPPSRVEDGVLIVPIVEEVAVVEKRLFLKEELRIRVNETTHVDTQTVRLRREHAEVALDGAATEVTNPRSMP